MADIIVRLNELEHRLFLEKVGRGNMAACVRQYIRATIEKNDDITESIKRRQYAELKKQKEKLDAEFSRLKLEIDTIDNRNEAERVKEEEEFEKEKQKMSDIKHDSLKAQLYKMV